MPWQNQSGGSGGGPWGGGGQGGGGQGGGGDKGGGPWGGGSGDNNGSGSGRPPGGGKHDLEDMLRKGQDRMRGLFSGGGKKGLALIIVVIAGLWAASGFYRVEPGEQALVLRFGQWVNQADPKLPGLHWHLPYPVETVEILNVEQERRTTIGAPVGTTTRTRGAENFVLTQDQNIVQIDYTVIWKIKDPGLYVFAIRDQEATLLAVAESVMREVVGRSTIQQVLSQSDSKIVIESKELIQRILDEYNSGILVTAVTVSPPRPPEEVADAFEDVQRAGQDQDRVINEAEAYRNKVVPEARGAAARAIQEAEAYKSQVIKEAEGEAARFLSVYTEYAKAPELTRRRIYIETLQEVFSKTDKMLIDPTLDGAVPYLPLNELAKPRGQ